MARMRLGNVAPVDDGAAAFLAASDADHVATYVDFGDKPLMECAADVTTPGRGLWDAHSSEPPSWVASDDSTLAQVIGAHYGCRVCDWDESVHGEGAL